MSFPHSDSLIFNELLNHTLNSIYQISGTNARVGHRNRLNIFDVVKVAGALRMGAGELKAYLKWSRSESGKEFGENIFGGSKGLSGFKDQGSKDQSGFKGQSSKDHQPSTSINELVFSLDVNEVKRPGYDYLPPLPSAFTFKSTPIYGKREEEALAVLKRMTREKLQVENNLFEGIKGKITERVINYDDI